MFHRLRARLSQTMRRTPARSVPVVRSRIEFDRRPRPEWQAALDAQHIAGTARLYIAWEPGDRWQPIHRWMLWQLQPWAHVDQAFKDELRGPHPRTDASLTYLSQIIDGVRQMRPRITGGPCRLIDKRTWELHHEIADVTGELVRPRRLWVIQGDAGGHPFAVTPAEEKYRRACGLTPDVPSAGDLPYAEFDRRVMAALERYDLWRFAHGIADPITNAAKLTIAALGNTEIAAHRLMWQQLVGMSEQWADGAGFAARQDGLHRLRSTPVGYRHRDADIDRAMDEYINDLSIEDA